MDRRHIRRGVLVNLGRDNLATDTVLAILTAGEVVDREATRSRPGDLAFNAQQVLTRRKTHVTHLTPVLTPAVAHDPVLLSLLGTPSNNTDNMVGTLRVFRLGKDATTVLDNRLGVDRRRDRSTNEDLRLDVLHDILVHLDHSVLGNRRVGEVINLRALTTHTRKGIASTTNVVRLAGRVELGTKSLTRVLRTGQIAHASIVGHESLVLNELVRRRVVSSVTRPGRLGAAVENVLDAEIDVVALAIAGNLDAIREAAQGTMGPAAATVLRDVLVERVRQVRDAVHVGPRKGILDRE